jgi:oligosaccharide repeat unit polymerase
MVERLPAFTYKPIPVFKYNVFVIITLYLFFILDALYTGYVPLFAFSSGDIAYGGSINYGIPTFHVLLVTFTLFFSLHLFHQFLSNRKASLFVWYLLTFVPFIFLLQRSAIMYLVIGSVFIFFISQKRLSVRKISGLAIFVLAAIYMFGFLGNIRSANGDSTFIPRNSGVKEEFLESWIPNEFYWGYLYIASPVANLQNNINIEQNPDFSYSEFFMFEMIPDFLQKQLTEKLGLQRREFNQINSFLNVGTIYARPFSYLSWWGMFFIFLYLIILMNLYYLIVKKSYMYGVTGVAMMFSVIAIANFDNSIWYSGYSFPLFYPVLFSVLRGFRIKSGKKVRPSQQLSLQRV